MTTKNKWVQVCTAFMRAAGAFWSAGKEAIQDGKVSDSEWAGMSLAVSENLEKNLPVSVSVNVSIEPK